MIPAAEQVAFVEKTVPLRQEDRILDLACGFGRHSLLLAQKGYSVVGQDFSSDYIERAQAESERQGVDVHFERGDMRSLSDVEKFDVVLSLQSSLTFYDDEVNREIIRRIREAIKPGGTFVYDQVNVFHIAAFALKSEPMEKTLSDGRVHRKTISFDATTCRCVGRSVLRDGSGCEEAGWDMRFYTQPELSSIASEVGFEIVGCYGGFDGRSYALDSPRLIAFMKKL